MNERLGRGSSLDLFFIVDRLILILCFLFVENMSVDSSLLNFFFPFTTEFIELLLDATFARSLSVEIEFDIIVFLIRILYRQRNEKVVHDTLKTKISSTIVTVAVRFRDHGKRIGRRYEIIFRGVHQPFDKIDNDDCKSSCSVTLGFLSLDQVQGVSLSVLTSTSGSVDDPGNSIDLNGKKKE